MIYLIVRKRKTDYSEDYRIEKWARTTKDANKLLGALTLLEDDEDSMHFNRDNFWLYYLRAFIPYHSATRTDP